jgi:signal peptidase
MPVEETDTLVILREDILNRGRHFRILIKGRSMFPMLRDGDVVEIRDFDLNRLRVGDLLLFKTESGQLVLHRYLGQQIFEGRVWLTTKGDASRGCDRPIAPQQILGRVVQIHSSRGVQSLEGLPARLANYIFAKISPYRHILGRIARGLGLQKLIRGERVNGSTGQRRS